MSSTMKEIIPARVSALSDAIRRGLEHHGARFESRRCVRSVVYDVGHAVSLCIAPHTAVASVLPAGHLHAVTPPTLVLFIRGEQYTVCEWREGDNVFPVTLKTADGQVYEASDEESLHAEAARLLSSHFFACLMRKITLAVKA
jgi:hypothetical protein